MNQNALYYYKKNRKQRSWIFINMSIACLVYIAGLYGYEYFFNKSVSENFKYTYVTVFSISCVILFCVAWWHRKNPAVYEAVITADRFIVNYPGSKMWSFDIKVADIKRFEHRNTLSHAGDGIGKSGVLLHDGRFFEISMNYGNNIKEMCESVKIANPDVSFPKKVNQKVYGSFAKDYDE